jgi:hypothetical protein
LADLVAEALVAEALVEAGNLQYKTKSKPDIIIFNLSCHIERSEISLD